MLKIYIFQMKNILKTILLAGTVYFDYSNTIGIDIQSWSYLFSFFYFHFAIAQTYISKFCLYVYVSMYNVNVTLFGSLHHTASQLKPISGE